MAKPAALSLGKGTRALYWAEEAAIVISASLFVALCARVTLPLPFTPVPLTLQNFGVLLVGLTLGSRRGFAALALYLIEGASGMPVFNPAGPGGVAQLLGATGGFLMAYPFVAGIAGWIMEHRNMDREILDGQTATSGKNFARACLASLAGEVVLFAGGLSWLAIWTHSFAQALRFGLYWFVFAEVIKVMLAAAAATGWQYSRKEQA
jgi:biotin transport system substrate-specific component